MAARAWAPYVTPSALARSNACATVCLGMAVCPVSGFTGACMCHSLTCTIPLVRQAHVVIKAS